MKRLFSVIAIICALAMILCATGCGESKKPETTTTATEAATEAVTEAATEAATEEATEAETEAPAEAETESPAEVETEAPAEAETEAPAEAEPAAASDSLTPSIVIEYGDFDAMEAFMQDAMNFKVEEGTVVQISGFISTDTSKPSVMEDNGEGKKKGITMIIEGDWEAPANGTDIDVIGTMVKGQYNMEYHVLPENITVK